MFFKNSVGCILFVFVLLLGLSNSALAGERVLGSWISKGKLFSVGDKKFAYQGEANGVVHHNDGKGKLDAAKLYCSISMFIDHQNKQENGSGFCAITVETNDKIYANFKCAGPIKECTGSFNYLGGTGKFKGISGKTELRWKAHVIQSESKQSDSDFVEEKVSGYFVLPNLTYSMP